MATQDSPKKKTLTPDDLTYLTDTFDAHPDASRDIFTWMVENFEEYDSIQMIDEAIDQWGDKYFELEEEFFQELADLLYSEE